MTTARRRLTGPRRQVRWVRIRSNENAIVDGASERTIIFNASVFPELVGSTLTRIVGTVFYRGTDAGPVLAPAYSMGILVARQEAADAGISALPDPESAAAGAWLHWRATQLRAAALPTDTSSLVYYDKFDLDIGAQRKMGTGMDIVLITHNAVSGMSITESFGLSMLFKLP